MGRGGGDEETTVAFINKANHRNCNVNTSILSSFFFIKEGNGTIDARVFSLTIRCDFSQEFRSSSGPEVDGRASVCRVKT